MLPAAGLTILNYRGILTNTEKYWTAHVKRHPDAADKLNSLLDSSYLNLEMEALGVGKLGAASTLKNALLILHCSLGKNVTERFFRVQQEEVVASMIPYAVGGLSGEGKNFIEIAEERGISNFQFSVLYCILNRLCFECGGSDPMGFLINILNQLPLPYGQHLTIINALQESLKSHRIVVH